MDTLILQTEDELRQAAGLLRAGRLVAVPTETVYGLCANGLDEKAVAELYECKGRPEIKPLSLMVPDAAALERYASSFPPAARILAEKFWPGPLTLVLPAREDLIPPLVRAGGSAVALRCPDSPLTLSLLRILQLPLAGPSANPSGQPSPTSADEVLGYFRGRISAVIDGGVCAVGRESTIFSLAQMPYRVLRPGALPEEAIHRALSLSVRRIGITGGSGTGKTTVLRALEAQGALALDCDAVYHELLSSSEAMLGELRARFGGAVFEGAALNRKALGKIVFADAAALADLNAITHRYVREEVERRIEAFALRGGTLAAIDAVALFESGLAESCLATVSVVSKEELRLQRIMSREDISESYARARIAAQPPDGFYRARCTHVIENNGTPAELNEQIHSILSGGFSHV